MSDSEPRQAADPRLFAIRVAVGLAQGFSLYALYEWKKQIPPLAAGPLWAVAFLVPFVVLGAVGRLKGWLLAAWLAAAAALTAGLGLYDAWVGLGAPKTDFVAPPAEILIFFGAALFILHHLVTAAASEGRWRASYGRYFDDGWLDAIRLVLSALFVLALWALLKLGAELFHIIGIDVLRRLLEKAWFNFPIVGAFFAIGIHITDVRSSLVRGARTLALTLLSWLQPILAGLVAVFLLALPFTGLKPLWETKSATGVLLGACAALVILINATYQDGERADFPPFILRWAARLACALLAPMVVIAAYGLALRIGQHGLSTPRVVAATCLIVAAVYAAGYLWAAVVRGPWLRRLESTNWLAAHVAVAVVILIFSPLLDPARLSVGDQMRRLSSGKVTAADFDYRFLHFDAGRWGREALADLAAGKGAGKDPAVAKAAQAEQREKSRWEPRGPIKTMAQAIDVRGKPLPATFLAQDWPPDESPAQKCNGPKPCIALVGEVDGEPGDEVVLFTSFGPERVYGLRNDRWTWIGILEGRKCPDDNDAIRAGRFRFGTPPPTPSLFINGRLRVFAAAGTCGALRDDEE